MGNGATVESLILGQLKDLGREQTKQGKTLVKICTEQESHNDDLNKMAVAIQEVSSNQLKCPARSQHDTHKMRLDKLEAKKSTPPPPPEPEKASRLPQVILATVVKYAPWVLFITASGVIAVMNGWSP